MSKKMCGKCRIIGNYDNTCKVSKKNSTKI